MASIVDRGTRAAPKFFAKYDFVDASGERKQRWKLLAGVQTKKQATQELARVEREVAAGRDPFPERVAPSAIKPLLDQWGKSLKNRNADDDRSRTKRQLVPRFGKLTLEQITLPVVMTWIDELGESGLSPQTQRHAVNTLSRFFSWCIERGLATINPVRMVPVGKRPTPPIDRDQPWLEDESKVPELVTALGNDLGLAFYLANRSGMRLGEVVGLRMGDLDFLGDGVIRVAERGSSGVCSLCGKRRAHVALAQSVADVFKAIVRYHYSELAYNPHLGGDDLWRILKEPNPILNSDTRLIEQAEVETEFDFGVLIHELTDPAYNAGAQHGVFIYAGFRGDRRDCYVDCPKDAKAAELQKLAQQLSTTNAYALEEHWLALLAPTVGRIEEDIPVGTTFYRARIGVRDRAISASLFRPVATRGVGKGAMSGNLLDPDVKRISFPFVDDHIGAPSPLLATAGRLNRANVSLLYLADLAETAVAEVRPHPGHLVSLGKFSSCRSLRCANLSAIDLLPFTSSETDVDLFVLLRNIEHAFAMPVIPGNALTYLVTQFLADIFRKLGCHGLRFRSSVGAGTNLVSFDPGTFAYVPGSGSVRKICALKYEALLADFELERNPGVEYFPVPDGVLEGD